MLNRLEQIGEVLFTIKIEAGEYQKIAQIHQMLKQEYLEQEAAEKATTPEILPDKKD